MQRRSSVSILCVGVGTRVAEDLGEQRWTHYVTLRLLVANVALVASHLNYLLVVSFGCVVQGRVPRFVMRGRVGVSQCQDLLELRANGKMVSANAHGI